MLALVVDPLEYFKTVVTPDKLRISEAYRQRANAWSDVGVMVGTALALFHSSGRPRFSQPVSAGRAELRLSSFRGPYEEEKCSGD